MIKTETGFSSMIKRFATLAALTVAALSFAGQAHADYTLALTLNAPASNTNINFNGTVFQFAVPTPNPRTVPDALALNFNIINVAEPSASASGSGQISINESFTLTGTAGTPGLVTGTVTGTFTVTGGTSTFSGTITQAGTGFTVSGLTYAPPSLGSSIGSSDSGNISFTVTPTAVPEPTSVAVMGLGMAGLSFISFFRRRRVA